MLRLRGRNADEALTHGKVYLSIRRLHPGWRPQAWRTPEKATYLLLTSNKAQVYSWAKLALL
ncbi:hypothetical protein SCLCIDRAFT_1212857 [Scleroderma citrinum Foug A]|uniref:Uncharacterized protein n=1 Tax=Scleroderma citrinum Foug A TaxID=1036808 RepID=A0A0C3E8R5_9AGAM|nr:hypothetical protein SCLCIDRAFT_1212857 [Scleroderma citrinum Foug A]